MKLSSLNNTQAGETRSFDLKRLSKSKETVDICPNTLRAYNREGLRFYRAGKAVFFSQSELEAFIRSRSVQPASSKAMVC